MRRLTRLEPPYFISLLSVHSGADRLVLIVPIGDVAPHLLGQLRIPAQYDLWRRFPAQSITVAWSLEVEVQFYVMVPLITIVFAISNSLVRRAVILFLMLCTGLFSNPLYPNPSPARLDRVLSRILPSGLPCLRSYTLRRGEWKQSFRLGRARAIRLAASVAFGTEHWSRTSSFRDRGALSSGFSGAHLFGIVQQPHVITGVGGMCYSIYLFHVRWFSPRCRALDSSPCTSGQNFWVYFALQGAFSPCLWFCCFAARSFC